MSKKCYKMIILWGKKYTNVKLDVFLTKAAENNLIWLNSSFICYSWLLINEATSSVEISMNFLIRVVLNLLNNLLYLSLFLK